MKDEERVKLASNLYDAWKKLLPDSRLERPRHTIRGPLGSMEECFCVNCGRPGGFVTEDAVESVVYLCEACVFTHGHLPLPQIPDDLVRGNPTEQER
jgi:hypothetical protein